jgi:streptogramin lyase
MATATAIPTAPPSPSATPLATLAGCPAPVALSQLPVLHQFTTDADDVAVDSRGDIWVSSPNAGRIDELGADGTSIATFVDPNEPEGLVPLPDGDVVVAEQGPNRLDVLVPSTRVLTPLLTIPNSTGNAGVDDIALSADGAEILVPDSPSGRLLEIPVGGGTPTVLASGLGRPVDAEQLPDGAIVVAAESNPGLVEVAGGATQAVGSLTDLDEAIPDDGLVYVTDLGTDEVLAVDPTSGASHVLVTVSPSPQGLVALPDGSLLLVDSTREVIVILSPCA